VFRRMSDLRSEVEECCMEGRSTCASREGDESEFGCFLELLKAPTGDESSKNTGERKGVPFWILQELREERGNAMGCHPELE